MAKQPPRIPLHPDELQAIRDHHATGDSCNAIARTLGRSASTVSRAARDLGLTWGTERTAAAVAAKRATTAEKRATLETRLLDEAGLLLDQLHKPHTVYNFGGRDNTYAEHELTEPDVGSKKALIQAVGTAVDKSLRLRDADSASSGADVGRSLVGNLFAGLQAMAGQDAEQATAEVAEHRDDPDDPDDPDDGEGPAPE